MAQAKAGFAEYSQLVLNYRAPAGTDEVGRGPLAGDVVAAAVILHPEKPITGLNDSKKLTLLQRERCFLEIQDKARAYSVARANVAEIDELNILHASLLAMRRAVEALAVEPDYVFVDGNRCPEWGYASRAVIKGDSLVPAIAAASILAKVTRDQKWGCRSSAIQVTGLPSTRVIPPNCTLKNCNNMALPAIIVKALNRFAS